MDKILTIALVGQPNVGKSLLINALCGSMMKVGNFPGVTIQKAEAHTKYKDYDIKIIDLPGTYSLHGYSEEEKVTREFLEKESYDLIINVADSTNLERNLLLSAQLLEAQKKMILALNMSDEAKKEGVSINEQKLGDLLGISAIKISASKKENLNLLLDKAISLFEQEKAQNKRIYSNAIETEILKIQEFLEAKNDELASLGLTKRQIAILLLKQDEQLFKILHQKPIYVELAPILQESLNNLYIEYNTKSSNEIFLSDLNAFVSGLVTETLHYENNKKETTTQKVDKILTNKYAGIPIFLFFMWLLFQLTFTLGAVPMEYIESFFSWLGEGASANIPNELVASMISDGVIAGVGSVILFLPNIIILFFGIALLETTGYMSRVAFLLDGFFHKFGLHGKSFIPLVTGFGCSVPAFMATRTLKSRKDRLLTLFIINFMSCGARLPVYVLFVGAFFPAEQAGNWLFGIYILGALLGLAMAKILRLSVFRGPDEPFVMEMPKYRLPSGRLVWFAIYSKAKMYLKKAGTFILAASLLIWFASTFPAQSELDLAHSDKISELESKLKIDYEKTKEEIATLEEKGEEVAHLEGKIAPFLELEHKLEEQKIEGSYLGSAGKIIEPFFAPLGFDWKMSVSLVSGLAAKEVVISTMGVLYSLGSEVDESNEGLMQRIKKEIPLEIAVSFILFVMIYNPCLAASVVFGKEAGGLKYSIYLFLFTTIVAYIIALLGGIIAKGIIG